MQVTLQEKLQENSGLALSSALKHLIKECEHHFKPKFSKLI